MADNTKLNMLLFAIILSPTDFAEECHNASEIKRSLHSLVRYEYNSYNVIIHGIK